MSVDTLIKNNKLKCIQKNITKRELISKMYDDITLFDEVSTRNKNDDSTKKRENILEYIYNDKIPNAFYDSSNKWKNLKKLCTQYIKKLCEEHGIDFDNIHSFKCEHMGGRQNNYDFKFIINNISYPVEFKYNADDVSQAPEFVSPMNPSKFIDSPKTLEENYYDNYLSKICNKINIPLPERTTYLKEINSTNPKCMKECQETYDRGSKRSSKYTGNPDDIDFYNYANKISREFNNSSIDKNGLNIDKLNTYFKISQEGKNYMLFKNGNIILQLIDTENYKIVSYEKEANKYRYVATTKTGLKLNILLRWKNGNGIAFPAFQIKMIKMNNSSRYDPDLLELPNYYTNMTVNELKIILRNNKIKVSGKKAELIKRIMEHDGKVNTL